jgi:hypothetical protein
LDIESKGERVYRYHAAMIDNLLEVLAAAGLDGFEQLAPRHIHQRVEGTRVKNYAEMYPPIPHGCLLADDRVPGDWRADWALADAHAWTY